jgi:hypothetical protein
MRIVCMAAEQGPNILLFMPNTTMHIQFIHVNEASRVHHDRMKRPKCTMGSSGDRQVDKTQTYRLTNRQTSKHQVEV